VTTADVVADAVVASPQARSPRQLFWARFKQDKAALVAGVVIVLLVFLALFGGPIAERITGHGQNEPFFEMTDEFGVPWGRTRSSGSARTPRDETSSCGRCTGRGRRSWLESSRPVSR
jgi:hypothetical protein